MRTLAAWGGLVLVVFTLTSCATWQAAYLKAAANRATQDEVTQRFGPPLMAWDLTTGETLSTYRSGSGSGGDIPSISVAGPGWVIANGAHCTEYILLFDREKILRAWTAQKC